MTLAELAAAGVILAFVMASLVFWIVIRTRGMDRCLFDYVLDLPRRRLPRSGDPVHVLLCIADHFEPKRQAAAADLAARRVSAWTESYPRLFEQFRDRDGRPPQHTFFYPADEYEPEHLDRIADLCRRGFGEVEVHLHHHDDTSDGLRRTLEEFKQTLAQRHGLLSRRRLDGEIVYSFIHGNWALDNSRPDGKHCGVNNELDVLRETGCYADLTMPSAPDRCQTKTINRIYYATDDPAAPRSHDRGVEVGSTPQPDHSLMLIQGPLLLNWSHRKWGLIPRLENGCIQANQPPTIKRLEQWLQARVQIRSRPDWFFIKLHTHGAHEANQRVLLGQPMIRFHQALADRMRSDPSFHVHYVTARELFNLAKAAEAGHTGSVQEARDFDLVSLLSADQLSPTIEGSNRD